MIYAGGGSGAPEMAKIVTVDPVLSFAALSGSTLRGGSMSSHNPGRFESGPPAFQTDLL